MVAVVREPGRHSDKVGSCMYTARPRGVQLGKCVMEITIKSGKTGRTRGVCLCESVVNGDSQAAVIPQPAQSYSRIGAQLYVEDVWEKERCSGSLGRRTFGKRRHG